MSTAVLKPATDPPRPALHSSATLAGARRLPWPTLLYAAVVLLTCAWVLSLPIFPSQDEPLHLYYVDIFRQLLQHRHTTYTATYQIRHYLPPYAAYYYGLIGLSHFVSLETADKLFVTANIALFAVAGYRLLRVFSPRARWAPFLLLPVLLNWPSFMGFANYMLSVNLGLFAIACWCRATQHPGLRYTIGFLALIAAMILTHPLPWAFVLGFAGLELLLRVPQARLTPTGRARLRRDLLTLVPASLSYLYLLPFQTKTQVITRLVFDKDIHAWRTLPKTLDLWQRLYAQAFSLIHTQGITLFMESRLSHAYRLGVAFLFGGSLLLAAWAALLRRHPGQRLSRVMLLYAILLAAGLILVPDSGAGGYYIATRMQLLVYVCCVAAAAPALEHRPRLASTAAAFSVALTGLTLFLAVRYINPVAANIAALRAAPAPSLSPADTRPGFLMRPVGAAFPPHLNYDAYNWAPVHYFRWHGLLLYNTAWLGERLIPIQPRPDALPRLDSTFFNQAPEFGDRILRTDTLAAQTLSHTSFLLLQKEAVKPTQNPFAKIGGSPNPAPFAKNWHCTLTANGHWRLCEPGL